MTGLLVCLLLCFLAYKTSPSQDSFKAFLDARQAANQKRNNFFRRLFSSSSSSRYAIQDYGLFKIAKLKDPPHNIYLGCISSWFPISEMILAEVDEEASATGSKNGTTQEGVRVKAEVMKQQGNDYRAKHNLVEAAKSYFLAGKIFYSLGSELDRMDSASCYHDAYKCYNQEGMTDKALESLLQSSDIYTKLGKDSQAAKCHEAACLLLERNGRIAQAIQHAKTGAEINSRINQSEFSPMLEKYGELNLKLLNYDIAFETYEKLARLTVDMSTLRFSTKNYLYNALLAFIGKQDWAILPKKLREYCALDLSFEQSREYVLIRGLINAKDRNQKDEFATRCVEYNSITPFPDHIVLILNRMKESINEEDLK